MSHLCFKIELVKTESDFIVISVETDLGRFTLVVAVISVDAYPFLAFSDMTFYLEDTGIGDWSRIQTNNHLVRKQTLDCFLVALCQLIVSRPNLELGTKRLLHDQVKIMG